MKTPSHHFAAILALAALLFIPSIRMQAKKPVFKNTKWVCIQEQFVADAGTMTETHTLEFTSAKDCLLKVRWVLPAHPAMYRNPDGTVDIIPGSSSEYEQAATYRYRSGKLTLQMEDGSTKEYLYRDGQLTDRSLVGEGRVFELVKD